MLTFAIDAYLRVVSFPSKPAGSSKDAIDHFPLPLRHRGVGVALPELRLGEDTGEHHFRMCHGPPEASQNPVHIHPRQDLT